MSEATTYTTDVPHTAPDSHPDRAAEILRDVFGYADFRPGQREIIDAVLAGENVLVVMPTGAGKSLCFQVPALVQGGLTVVVSPLVALMEDQVAALRLAGVAADRINSSRHPDDNAATWRRVAAGDVRLLYLAPERLMTERMLAALADLPVRLLAVDEAHCISRWGPAFRPEYEDLGRLGELFPGVPIAAFTATADAATREDIAGKLFRDVGGRTFVAGFDRPNIRLAVDPRRDWKRQLLAVVRAHEGEAGIVYCLSRRKTEETAAFLRSEGVRALPYHAGMAKAERTANQDAFMTDPGVVMVATIAFGMGIDKPDVRYVFHVNLPANVEAYYQELGRAGRDGAPAEAVMLYGLDDLHQRRQFIEEDGGDADHVRREHKRLDALIAYCEAPDCRRRTLLAYFGEAMAAGTGGEGVDGGAGEEGGTGGASGVGRESGEGVSGGERSAGPEGCGNCDVCLDPPKVEDGTELGQKALSAVYRTGQRFGAAHVIDVLRGADTEKIRRMGHDALPTYGVGADLDRNAWRAILRQLVAAGFLRIDIAGFGGLKITETGRALLRGAATFAYRPDALRAAKPAAARRAAASAAELPAFDPADADLLAALKALRLRLAQERGVPAYVIFQDRSLMEMAHYKPMDEAAFADIFGVGKARLRDFAASFLAVIRAHTTGSNGAAEEEPPPADPPPAEFDDPQPY